MKRKLKTLSALLLTCCTLFVGCQSFDDLIPEEYGAWDNHYIYRGNVRSKTTGEDFEYLVTEVEYGATSYEVQNCADYTIAGNDIYMCLSLVSQQQGLLYTNGIVKYNVQSKTQEVLYVYEALPTQSEGAGTRVSYNPSTIDGLSQEGLLLFGQKESASFGEEGVRDEITYSNQSVYFLMDFEGNIVKDAVFNYNYFAKVNDTYYSNTDYKDDKWNFYYVTMDMQEPKLVCQKPIGDDYQTTFVEKNGAVGFLISTLLKPQDGNANTQLSKLEFYNIKTDTLTTLYEGTRFVKWIEIPRNEYFVSYDYETVSYHYREGLFTPKQEASVAMKTNCVVHQIIYSEQGVKCETFQHFGRRKDITDIRAIMDGKLLAKLVWYEDARGCAFGGVQSGNYEINLVTGKQESLDSEEFKTTEDDYFGYYARQTGKTCGDYIYYLQKEELSAFMSGSSYAYLLQRYNTKSEKTEVMQLWHEDYARSGEKCCEEMWRSKCGDIEEFIVRGY